MRGKLFSAFADDAVMGITPADAGKTQSLTKVKSFTKDHPRGCGENMSTASHAVGFPGSPPRMRGKLLYQSGAIMSRRITPADAGKTAARL